MYDAANYCGGPTIVMRRLLPELQRRGHEPIALIVNKDGEGPAAGDLRQHGVACHTLPWVRDTKRLVRSILKLLKECDPDVFVPYVSTPAHYAARWVREAGIPTIGCHLGNDVINWAKTEQFTLNDAGWAVSGVYCVSEELQRAIEQRGTVHSVLRVIPPGTPLPERVATQEGPLRLVYAGRMAEHEKRISKVVDALCRTLVVRPDIAATLVGDGPERERLQREVDKRGLADRIRFAGLASPQQLLSLLSDHHILVLLSDYEGQPGAVIDGMACGLVPVCLDIPGGLRELVIHEETGLLVLDREQSFLDAIVRLADDPTLRRRLAANAREHIRKGFSLSVTADRWEQFFEQLLAEAGPRRRIRVPHRLVLPPPHPDLAKTAEDPRPPSWSVRANRWYRRTGSKIKRQLLRLRLPPDAR